MLARARIDIASMAGRIAVGYALVASLAAALALALRDELPWHHGSPWLSLSALHAGLLSVAGGLVLAALVVAGTRVTVARFPWAQRLHLDLQPVAEGLRGWQIALIAGFSSLGEELLFRGLAQPALGVLPAAVVFGICHQVPGPARWVWVCWATAVGLCFGLIFAATGNLLGPLLAHALINAINLRFLRDHDLPGYERTERPPYRPQNAVSLPSAPQSSAPQSSAPQASHSGEGLAGLSSLEMEAEPAFERRLLARRNLDRHRR